MKDRINPDGLKGCRRRLHVHINYIKTYKYQKEKGFDSVSRHTDPSVIRDGWWYTY